MTGALLDGPALLRVVAADIEAGRLVAATQAVMAAPPALFATDAGRRITPHLTSALLFAGFVDLCRMVSSRLSPEITAVREARLMHYAAELDPDQGAALRRAAVDDLLARQPQRPPSQRAIHLDRRLRIGHLIADAARSSAEHFRAAEIQHHDRARFRLFHYASKGGGPPDERRIFDDAWVDAAGLDDAALCDRIQADRIDILIDHCDINAGARLPLLAAQPAPVQVSRGALGPMGVPTVTWRLTDPICQGPGLNEHWTERPVLLPCMQCYTPPADAPAPATRPPQPGAILFGAFVQPVKITRAVARCWARILNALPGSRLVLKRRELASPDAQARLFNLLKYEGAPIDRIGVAGDSDRIRHLGLVASVDVALDSFPFGGHTTTCEALWMGTPAPALLGDRFVGRLGPSYLAAAGCGDWIARDEEDYVRIVLDLVADPDRLWAIRQGLRAKVAASLLCDGVAYTRALEAAYEMMALDWTRRCVALPDPSA